MKKRFICFCLLCVLLFNLCACKSNEPHIINESSTESVSSEDNAMTTTKAIDFVESFLQKFINGDEETKATVFRHIEADILEKNSYFEDSAYDKTEMFKNMTMEEHNTLYSCFQYQIIGAKIDENIATVTILARNLSIAPELKNAENPADFNISTVFNMIDAQAYENIERRCTIQLLEMNDILVTNQIDENFADVLLFGNLLYNE